MGRKGRFFFAKSRQDSVRDTLQLTYIYTCYNGEKETKQQARRQSICGLYRLQESF